MGLINALQLSFFADARRRPPAQLLVDWHSLVDVAESAAAAGISTTVIQASHVPGRIERNGVNYFFMAPREDEPLARSPEFIAHLAEVAPQVLHVHGLGFARDVVALRELAPRTPMLLQDHADRPPRWWRRSYWRRGVSAANGVSFCAREQAREFSRRGLLPAHVEVFEIPESTSGFGPGDRTAARAATGLSGDPCVLWVGHLDRNKDPLTVLAGVAAAIDKLPRLRLWCCFGTAPLLDAVRTRINADPRLHDRVHLLGRVAHERVETLMQAADLFVLGSHREGSSFSLIEALATGLVPVVTDIPSLRALTGGGSVGELWRCGDAESLTAALVRAAGRVGAAERARTRQHFQAKLSHQALGRCFAAAYESLIHAHP
ncbi:MAG TPA: glycosyltransferase family 4 protein [Steroidobacteraceae bacterium]|nr:glycosyltransferase family 4 protein [Steroidobacteraceae bacterium]